MRTSKKHLTILLTIITFLFCCKTSEVPPPSTDKPVPKNWVTWNLIWALIPHPEKQKFIGYVSLFYTVDQKILAVDYKVLDYVFKKNEDILNYSGNNDIIVGEQGFQTPNFRIEYDYSNQLITEFNKTQSGSCTFIDTFIGSDRVIDGKLYVDGKKYDCFIMKEICSADPLKQKWWEYETYIFLKGQGLSLIGLHYKDYTKPNDYRDGIVSFNNKEYIINQIDRKTNIVTIHLKQGGQIIIKPTFTNIYKSAYPNTKYNNESFDPLEKLFFAEVQININDKTHTLNNIPGHMEVIGETP